MRVADIALDRDHTLTLYCEASQTAKVDAMFVEVERLRMQVVACGVVALADTPDSAIEARKMHPDYRSDSLSDVERRVDECIRLRAEVERLRERETELDAEVENLLADYVRVCNLVSDMHAAAIRAKGEK